MAAPRMDRGHSLVSPAEVLQKRERQNHAPVTGRFISRDGGEVYVASDQGGSHGA